MDSIPDDKIEISIARRHGEKKLYSTQDYLPTNHSIFFFSIPHFFCITIFSQCFRERLAAI